MIKLLAVFFLCVFGVVVVMYDWALPNMVWSQLYLLPLCSKHIKPICGLLSIGLICFGLKCTFHALLPENECLGVSGFAEQQRTVAESVSEGLDLVHTVQCCQATSLM